MKDDTPHQRAPEGHETRIRYRWLGVAVALHALALGLYALRPSATVPQAPPRPPAAVSLREHRQAVEAARRARAKLSDAPRKVAAPPTAPEPAPLRGQIVEVAPSADDQAPHDARYLAERNSHTAHETRSRHAAKPHDNVMPEPSRSAPGAVAKHVAPPPKDAAMPLGTTADKARDAALKPREQQVLRPLQPAQKAQERLALRRQDSLGQHENRAQQKGVSGEPPVPAMPSAPSGPRAAPSPGTGLTMADLIPSVGTLARLNGGPSNDALQDVDEGEGTFLNAREFKYASYFMRIKRGVADRWRAADEYQRRDPTGQIYGYRSRTTGVRVTLAHDGSLKAVQLAESSGVDFLDREGLRAFERAAPFPNPPKALLDAADEITFQFSFVFSLSRQGFYAAPY